MGLEDEGKPVDNVKNEEQDRKGLEEKLINPEKYESKMFKRYYYKFLFLFLLVSRQRKKVGRRDVRVKSV